MKKAPEIGAFAGNCAPEERSSYFFFFAAAFFFGAAFAAFLVAVFID
jgi:hypothetical protein